MVLDLLLLFLFQQPDPNSAGLQAIESKDYHAAVAAFQKAIAADPSDYSAHFHLALAHSLLKNHTAAIAGYRKTLELKPGLYEAELNLGIVLLERKQPLEAVAHLSS